MMLVRLLCRAILAAGTGFCVTTTAAQAVGVGWLWSNGMLTHDKAVRYAALLYGLDLSEIPSQDQDETLPSPHAHLRTHDELLAERVERSQLLKDRHQALDLGNGEIRLLFEAVRSDKERFDEMKTRFDAHLAQLESDVLTASVQEVQRTLEALRPRQAKELLLRMLDDQGVDENDDVLAGVVTIVNSMPQDKRKRIFGEFKTEEERELLHVILLQIGDLAPADETESGREGNGQ
jgi:hypothetical protein